MSPVPSGVIERFAQFPRALASRTKSTTLAGVPALIAHPDWQTPAPVMVWMHGRTANKELDPGRYLRFVRAGIAAVALDLPGHGARADASMQQPSRTLDVLRQMLGEVDAVTDALASPEFAGLLDLDRVGIGGMSAGGMVALRRLCEGHDFACAAVECTTGWLEGLYFPTRSGTGAPGTWPFAGVTHDRSTVMALDAASHLRGFRPLPLLALHASTDQVVPLEVQDEFLARLRRHYTERGAPESLIERRTWADTGAPLEHAGFGRFGNDAKNAQVEFLTRVLRPTPPPPEA